LNPLQRSPIPTLANAALELQLRDKLRRLADRAGRSGELESIAVRIGLIQRSVEPAFHNPQLIVFAADHGLAVDLALPHRRGTREIVQQLLGDRLPLPVLARRMGLGVTVIDCGIADELPTNERLLQRKIAHATRNARVGPAMSVEQAHAAIRAGMEIGEPLRTNAVVCAAVGVGSHESAALIVSRLGGMPVRELLGGARLHPDRLAHLVLVTQAALARHREVVDPVEVLAAFGGFEVAVMVGVLLVTASRRGLIVIDGMPACAALLVAARIAPTVLEYCVFGCSHDHPGLVQAMKLLNARPLLELGLDTLDGTGAVLAWPLIQGAASLLSDVAELVDLGLDMAPAPLPAAVPDAAAAEVRPATPADPLTPTPN
jgi:nicotinate-nucleotide--dimethylbenzimidazole phosphoribosyltransferase